jgi:hypothetical protein
VEWIHDKLKTELNQTKPNGQKFQPARVQWTWTATQSDDSMAGDAELDGTGAGGVSNTVLPATCRWTWSKPRTCCACSRAAQGMSPCLSVAPPKDMGKADRYFPTLHSTYQEGSEMKLLYIITSATLFKDSDPNVSKEPGQHLSTHCRQCEFTRPQTCPPRRTES